jgi:hypothetical protein
LGTASFRQVFARRTWKAETAHSGGRGLGARQQNWCAWVQIVNLAENDRHVITAPVSRFRDPR